MPFVDEFKTLRERAGLRKVEVALKAQVSVDTVSRIEKHKNSSHETLVKLINALNALYYDEKKATIEPSSVIVESSRFGEGRDKTTDPQVVKLHKSNA